VWAFVRDTGVLIRVDQRTGKVRCFALGVWRGMPVVTAATRHAVWLADQHSARSDLIRVNGATGRIVARPRVPGRSGPIQSLTAAYGSLWILRHWRLRQPGSAPSSDSRSRIVEPSTSSGHSTGTICSVSDPTISLRGHGL
jgi:hypothetical protein